jgi:hypothetical protein
MTPSASDAAELVDRTAIIAEMDSVRSSFRQLVESADVTGLARRSNGTRWTNEQLLYHMLFGYMVVRALLILVKAFGRLPAGASRAFAVGLDRASGPFNTVNYWGSVAGAKVFNAKRMANKCDRVIGYLQRHLEREEECELRRAMHYPAGWDPFFKPEMTLADIYHYPTQHFIFHRGQLSL